MVQGHKSTKLYQIYKAERHDGEPATPKSEDYSGKGAWETAMYRWSTVCHESGSRKGRYKPMPLTHICMATGCKLDELVALATQNATLG